MFNFLRKKKEGAMDKEKTVDKKELEKANEDVAEKGDEVASEGAKGDVKASEEKTPAPTDKEEAKKEGEENPQEKEGEEGAEEESAPKWALSLMEGMLKIVTLLDSKPEEGTEATPEEKFELKKKEVVEDDDEEEFEEEDFFKD